MPHLNPAENFPIIRVLSDHTDSGTNYVQAVVRDAVTDAVLATLNLTDLGNRRFRYIWKVPYDNTFQVGRFIVITTTIYTDSGYTTKNPNYGEVGDTYLVQERWNQLKAAPGGAQGIDEKWLRGILAEELTKQKKDNPAEPIDFEPLISRLTAHVSAHGEMLAGKIDGIEMPESPEKVDLQPVLSVLEKVLSAISALPQTHPDMTVLFAEIRTLQNSLMQMHGALNAHATATKDALAKKQSELVVRHDMSFEPTGEGKRNKFLESLREKYPLKKS